MRGQNGEHGYFYCAGRHHRGNGCNQRHLPQTLVEDAVTNYWMGEQIPEEDVNLLRRFLAE